ncbi:MAG: mechanosensitive ion channel family protein [Candidatus Eremiobacteraeota bacterium]|nr:mechanosensitive ion channel family protein [Candidatus Eremiobacteraeota bacterium]
MVWNELEFLRKLLDGVIVFLLLNFIYFFTFKIVKWKSRLLTTILSRIRLISYFLVNVSVVWWFANFFPPTAVTPLIQSIILMLFVILLGMLMIEMFNGGFFDYFLPKVGKGETLQVYRQLLIASLYLVLLFITVGVILKVNVASLLTTSAIISVVIGLALQDTLGNLFAGLALNLSRPYSVGDFVKLDGYEGKIVSIDWRSISLLTIDDNIVTFPHSMVAKLEVLNYSLPALSHCRALTVNVHSRHSPRKVMNALKEIMTATEGILSEPAPRMRVVEYGDYFVKYKLVYWTEDFFQNSPIASAVMEKIWYKFQREDIVFPAPFQNIYLREYVKGISMEDKIALLKSIDFLCFLEDKNLEYLAEKLKILVFGAGETIFSQGEQGDTFYIVKKGKVLVKAENDKGDVYLEKEMKEGSFFGEISLLTGEPRTATVSAMDDLELFSMGKEDLRYILKQNPKVEETLSEALARRQQRSMVERERAESREQEGVCDHASQSEILSIADDFLKKIRFFFSY